jgi:hypothetical protein
VGPRQGPPLRRDGGGRMSEVIRLEPSRRCDTDHRTSATPPSRPRDTAAIWKAGRP